MTARGGNLAATIPTWNTPCCDRLPRHVGGDRYGCPACGQILFDNAATIAAVFGPGVVRCIAKRDLRPPVIYDGYVERMLDL